MMVGRAFWLTCVGRVWLLRLVRLDYLTMEMIGRVFDRIWGWDSLLIFWRIWMGGVYGDFCGLWLFLPT